MNLCIRILFTAIIFLFTSCKKEKASSNPVINILSPSLNQQFTLPDTIDINFNVSHNNNIEYIRISIDNNNFVPLTEHKFIYPTEINYQGSVQFTMGTLPNIVKVPPYYVHIAVSDFNNTHQEYLQIDLKNPELKYNGFYLIADTGIDVIELNFYNKLTEMEFSSTIEGNYVDSDISSTLGSLIINTTIPDLSRSFDINNGDLLWTNEPQLPYPEFTGINIDDEIVYLSTTIGRIIGLRVVGGLKVFTTMVLPDSIPNNICATKKYLIADFTLRNSGTKAWVSFYKETGGKYQVFQPVYETVDIYSISDDSDVIFFCNKQSEGQIITFNIENNLIENRIPLPNISIRHTCRLDQINYLFSDGRSIFILDLQNNSYIKVKETNLDIVDLKYNAISNAVYIAYNNKLEVMTYPDFITISTIESIKPIKAIELVFGY